MTSIRHILQDEENESEIKNHSACSALQLVKGTTASLHFQGQVWARPMNTVKAAGSTKAIHL